MQHMNECKLIQLKGVKMQRSKKQIQNEILNFNFLAVLCEQ